MAKVYVGLGTNLGDKEQNLKVAVQKIEEQIGKVVSLELIKSEILFQFIC